MNDKEQQMLTDLVTSIQNDVLLSLAANGRQATGNTAKNITVEQNGNAVQLTAPGYIDILERGRGPTSPDAPKGDPTVFDRIKEWCAAKGIEDKAAWPITKKIHKEGYAGKPGVLTEPLSDENLDKRATEAADNLVSLLITNTLKI